MDYGLLMELYALTLATRSYALLSYCGGCVVLFPGPAQLSVTSSPAGRSLETRLVLQAMEAGNEASGCGKIAVLSR